LEEFPVLVPLEQGQQPLQRTPGVADKADLDGISQTDAHRIEFDLNRSCLSGLRQEFDIWKGRSDHQQRIAVFQGFLRWLCSKQSDTAGRVGTRVRNCRFSEQRFDDWSA